MLGFVEATFNSRVYTTKIMNILAIIELSAVLITDNVTDTNTDPSLPYSSMASLKRVSFFKVKRIYSILKEFIITHYLS